MADILVAMSGGVDSSVAAGLLKEQGHTVWGVHMKLHESATPTNDCNIRTRTCCGDQDAWDAKQVARTLGIQFDVMDMQKEFEDSVIDNFISELKSGRTPIPCTHCNGTLKFDLLLKIADMAHCDFVATGHYAKIVNGKLFASTNQDKDQSYFLWPIKKDNLDRIMFPLSDMSKEEVRGHAVRLGLLTADKPESQDICFVPKGDYRDVVAGRLGDCSGDIVHKDTGEILGQHEGYYRYTTGQRRGLGINSSIAMYVHSIDANTKRVYVCEKDGLPTSTIVVNDINWLNDSIPEQLFVRVRHRGVLHDVENIRFMENNCAELTLVGKTVATPGQAAVIYCNDNVVAGGWIS